MGGSGGGRGRGHAEARRGGGWGKERAEPVGPSCRCERAGVWCRARWAPGSSPAPCGEGGDKTVWEIKLYGAEEDASAVSENVCSSCLVGRGVGMDTSLACAGVGAHRVCQWGNRRSVGVSRHTKGVQVCSRSRYAGLCGGGNHGSCPPLCERRRSRDWEPFVPPQSLGGNPRP